MIEISTQRLTILLAPNDRVARQAGVHDKDVAMSLRLAQVARCIWMRMPLLKILGAIFQCHFLRSRRERSSAVKSCHIY